MNDTEHLSTPEPAPQSAWRRRATGAGLLAGGLLIGAVLTGTLAANADTPVPTVTSSITPEDGAEDETVGPSQPQRGEGELLTGDALTQVTEAALAEYPGATIERVETDSDGVYEAHLVTADGERVTVELDESYAVTGTEVGGGPGGHGRGHHGGSASSHGQ